MGRTQAGYCLLVSFGSTANGGGDCLRPPPTTITLGAMMRKRMRGGRQGSAEVSECYFLCLEKAGWREVDEDPKMHFPSPRVREVPRLRQSGRKRKLKVRACFVSLAGK